MIPLGMVMLDVLAQGWPQGALSKQNNLRQTLLLHRSHPALRIGVQIRIVSRQWERFDLTRLDDRSEGDGEFCVAIMEEIDAIFLPCART